MLLLIALFITAIPADLYKTIFTGNKFLDSMIGALVGSVAAGNPLNSYIIGGELLDQGVSLIAITAFVLTWVTVGIVQLPAEMLMLGKRFAFVRNALCFVSAIIIAIVVSYLLPLL